MSDDLKERLANHPEAYSGGLCKEALARIEELEANLDLVLVERDKTFAFMLDRAQTAEAKLAKALEIAELFSGGVEYDYHGNIIGDEERKAMAELAELKGQDDE